MEDKLFCKECGEELSLDSKFCNKCGCEIIVEIENENESIYDKLNMLKENITEVSVQTDIFAILSENKYSYDSKMIHAKNLYKKRYITDVEYSTLKNTLDKSRRLPQNTLKNISVKQQHKANKKAGIVSCPKCGSQSITTTNKKISVTKGVVGGAVGSMINPVGTVVGAAVGATHSKKIENVCMNCGHRWKP